MSSLAVEKVTVRYEQAGRPVLALDAIELDLASGEFMTVVGANGAGKSTLAGVVAGSIAPSAGNVVLDGQNVSRVSEARRARRIARVLQDPRLGTAGHLTVAENMALATSRIGRRSALQRATSRRHNSECAELLAEYGRGLDLKVNRYAAELSGGQRQIVALTMAVASPPDVLLLDEHTSALDPEMAQVVMDRTASIIAELELTALMVTHNMAHAASYGKRCGIMNHGTFVKTVEGDEHAHLSPDRLIEIFRSAVSAAPTDRMLG
jgi:putative tryptophan/tyrosine transport system ATP-binding protein